MIDLVIGQLYKTFLPAGRGRLDQVSDDGKEVLIRFYMNFGINEPKWVRIGGWYSLDKIDTSHLPKSPLTNP